MSIKKLPAFLSLLLLSLVCTFAQDQPEAPAPEAEKIAAETTSLTIEARGLRSAKPPLFFSASTETQISVGAKSKTVSTTKASFSLLQGEAGTLSLKIIGSGEILKVEGAAVIDWAVRHQGGDRFLDIRPKPNARSFSANIIAETDPNKLPTSLAPITFGPGKAVGFSAAITVTAAKEVAVRITKAEGLAPAEKIEMTHQFHTQTDHALALELTRASAALAPAELTKAKLEGTIDTATKSATFVLSGEAIVTEAGAKLTVLSGHAAITGLPANDNFTLRLVNSKQPSYQLSFPQPGIFPVRIEFQAGLLERDSATAIDFKIPAGTVVPVTLNGVEKDVRFDSNSPLIPVARDGGHVGFLPADGHANVAWQNARESTEGKLFFSSDAKIETRVGAGLMRQIATIELNILQGKLDGINILLEGEGEILSVEGDNLLAWSVVAGENDTRMLEIKSARPATGTQTITVSSQAALGEFPAESTPLRLTPQGAVRHSGYLHVLSEGAVALEITKPTGLIQMAPGEAPAGVRQIFLYRFPSAQHSYSVSARQILPEVTVSQTTIYQMTETDRVITGRIELDITKAPLRDWTMRIPENYAVGSISGASLADYIHSAEVEGGTRALKLLFTQAVSDRQLINFRFERNIAAAEGSWQLPALTFPETKSVRGNVGVATVPGYRVSPAKLENLTEVPQNLFPLKFTGLQQTFRQREADWSADIKIEALPQSVQADVFHLYSLKEGIAYGSVLIDYAIIGSPVSEYRIAVPAEIGNLAIESQNVQSWRRDEEANQVIVTLHQPALGETTLLLTFEQPMDSRNGLLRPGQVEPVGVQGERGYIQVVSPSQVRQEIANASDGLLKIDSSELPTELKPLSSSPSLAVYQYSARPFDLQMNVQWFDPGETVDQVVDFAELESHVSSDGQVVTQAKFFVKTRGRKALRMKLPEGTKLWESRVEGQTVSARIDQGELLIPLSATLDPSWPVEVFVRIGQTASDPKRPSVTSPILLTPTLINSWKVQGDSGRRLAPAGDNTAELTRPILTETGFEWLRTHSDQRLLWLGIALFTGAVFCCCAKTPGLRQIIGIVALTASIWLAVLLADHAKDHRRVSVSTLEFVAPVIEQGKSLTLNLKDQSRFEALSSTPGLIAIGIGIALLIGGRLSQHSRWLALPAWVCILGGLLAQHGGTQWFFYALAAFIAVVGILPALREWGRIIKNNKSAAPKESNDEPEPETETPSTGGVTPTILVLAIAIGLGLSAEKAPAADDAPPVADSAVQSLSIEKNRLFADLQLSVSGKKDDTLKLLNAPVTLTKFEGEGLRITKRSIDGGANEYWIVLERDGASTANISYELGVPDFAQGITLPTSAAAIQQVELRVDQPGWSITSANAVRTEVIADLPEGSSGAKFTLSPSACPHITLQPITRDLAAEKPAYFAEVSNLFIPGPGIVDGRHRLTIRPSRGQVSELDLIVPAGFTVSDVLCANLTNWRFQPEENSLHLEINPPLSEPFAIMVETQMGSAALPTDLTLAPLGVERAESQVGTLALAFGADAQLEKSNAKGLSKVNQDDFDRSLLFRSKDSPPIGTLSQAYRYGKDLGSLEVTIAPVAADVRAYTKTTLSLGQERLVVAVDLTVNITRAGIFKLSFPIPDGLEIEAASGDSLASHTESKQDGKRVATLHLKGRTIGQQIFAITLAGNSPDAQADWSVPKFTINEAPRQTGQLLVVPEQGIRTQPVSRNHVSQLDARKLSQNRPGTLAFRLLEADWELKLRLEQLEPWVTAQVLQEVTAREGLTRTHLGIAYSVENAAVKSLRLELPGLTEDEQKTVRANGNAVSHIEKVTGEEAGELWEVHFQRRILGAGKIDIDYQRTTDRADGIENISIANLVSAKQSAYWVAVRVSGHLEVGLAGEAARGWQQADWSAIPKSLLSARNRAVPDLAFRAVDPEQALSVKVERHSIAEALRLSVREGRFTTAVAPDGASVTEALMFIGVVEKSTLRVVLPAKATLISAFVNDQSPGIVRENARAEGVENAYLFYVLPPEDGNAAEVSIAWSSPADGGEFKLQGPSLNIPLQNITWKVLLPNSLRLSGHEGNLDQVGEVYTIDYGIKEYASEQKQRINQDRNEANQLMVQANAWKIEGKQEKARSAFSKLSKKSNLDQATSEDARVQLRELQEERTLLSLTTRRQRNYFDNLSEDPSFSRNVDLEQAADQNPLLQGKTNYLPDQISTLLAGNTSAETDALKRITARLVSQQLAAEPAPQAIAINIPKHGQVLTFKRSVQVNGDTPLQLDLKVVKQNNSHLWILLPLIAVVALLLFTTGRNRPPAGS